MTALRKYRERCMLTQQQLAKKTGIAQSTIAQYENGFRKPDIIKLKKIAAILGCTTDDLLEPIEV